MLCCCCWNLVVTVLSIPFIFRKDGRCRGMIKKGSVSSASTLLVQMCFFKKVREQVVSVAAKQFTERRVL